ncbi:MAG: HAD-IIIC family phosphatase [Actinomycetota bacterium]|nr:HAD-IIIC family phosphatase [Actinomycetota bacterium]
MAADDILSYAQALAISRKLVPRGDGTSIEIGLACSFTPTHLSTFLAGYAAAARPESSVAVVEGSYGDIETSICSLTDSGTKLTVVVLDWSDLDPRLALRGPGAGGGAADEADLVVTAAARIGRVATAIAHLPGRVALVLPATAVPPALVTTPGRRGPLNARLRAMLAELAADMSENPEVRVIEEGGQGPNSRDVAGDLRYGMPHARELASRLARDAITALLPTPPKKGLVTDLDDTLWRGLVGEVGPNEVTWNLDAGSQIHAIYQETLAGLAHDGVLLAISSKNDPEVATSALAREDLRVPANAFFPAVVNWRPKSEGIAAILRAWNIAADDVVVVDDNPRELAEILAVHPTITAVEFPTNDPAAALVTVERLRALFWRDQRNQEDALRLDSLRAAERMRAERDRASDQTAFLHDLQAQITIDVGTGWRTPRALELINKTNQFNLNGIRHDPTSLAALGERPRALNATVAYHDRFGSLGTISVILGTVANGTLRVDTWVLSCRAFSRQVEQHVLRALATFAGARQVMFNFAPTARNGPTQAFLNSVGAGSPDWRIGLEFLTTLPELHHMTVVAGADDPPGPADKTSEDRQ